MSSRGPTRPRFVEAIGQAPDGTLYVKETTDDEWNSQSIVGLDGVTGRVKFRANSSGFGHRRSPNTAVYHEGNVTWAACSPGAMLDYGVVSTLLSGGAVGYDGAVYVLTYGDADTADYCADTHTYHREIQVMRVTSDGEVSTTVLDAADVTTTLSGGRKQVWQPTLSMVPDPRGGVHAEWTVLSYGGGQPTETVTRHGYAAADAQGLTAHTPVAGPLPFDRIGDGIGFDGSGVAYDLDTESVLYMPPVAPTTYVAALSGGGVAVSDGVTLWQLDETGAVVKESPMPSAAGGVVYGNGMWAGWQDPDRGPFAGEELSDSPAVYPDVNGTEEPGRGKALEAAVHLVTPWWPEINQQVDKDLIRVAAESALNEAFRGYVVHFTFDEQSETRDTARRHVWVRPDSGPGDAGGAVGVTYESTKYSTVHLRSLENALLAVRCSPAADDLAGCSTETGILRATLVTALGRGLGATIAHELGHQRYLGFTQDLEATPSNCYDAKSAVHLDHFFSPLQWSNEAKVQMSKVLLRTR